MVAAIIYYYKLSTTSIEWTTLITILDNNVCIHTVLNPSAEFKIFHKNLLVKIVLLSLIYHSL